MAFKHDKVGCNTAFEYWKRKFDGDVSLFPTDSRVCLEQRVIVYPNYIDSKKTVAEGRRIPRDKGKQTSTNTGSVLAV